MNTHLHEDGESIDGRRFCYENSESIRLEDGEWREYLPMEAGYVLECRARLAESQLAVAVKLLGKISQELTCAADGSYQKTITARFCTIALAEIKAIEESVK